MPTTPNYSWPTPASTDYVKDGATAIQNLGNAIDTTMNTVQTTANAAIAKSLVDAKGDLIVATADNTVARLAVGTNGQVLTADSTVTGGIKWATAAGGDTWTLVSSQALTSGSTHTFSSISGYRKLRLVAPKLTSALGAKWQIRWNGVTSSVYWYTSTGGTGDFDLPAIELNASTSNSMRFDIEFPVANQSVPQYGEVWTPTLTKTYIAANSSPGAINSVTLLLSTSTFASGTLYLYGVAE